jgi:hypothetical protein
MQLRCIRSQDAGAARSGKPPAGPLRIGRRMAAYRLYHVNGDGHIARAEWIEAESDEAAINESLSRGHPHRCELCDRLRLVAEIPPQRWRHP